MYHYLPYVKHEQNLRLVFASFLNSSVCFGPSNHGATFAELYLIIEVFKLVTDKKLSISQPSLSVKIWYNVIWKELTNFVQFNPLQNSWKILPIIAGMRLSNPLRYELYVKGNPIQYRPFFVNWDYQTTQLFKESLTYSISPSLPDNVVNLSLLSLAIFHDPNQNILNFTQKISIPFVVERLIDMIVSPVDKDSVKSAITHYFIPTGDNNNNNTTTPSPNVKHLNKIAILLESYLKQIPGEKSPELLISAVLGKLLTFNRDLNHFSQHSKFNQDSNSKDLDSLPPLFQEYWHSMKSILFAEILIFQGILTAYVTSGTTSSRSPIYQEICLKILHNLYYIHFILLSIGQGGFDSYNFDYYVALEVVLNHSRTTGAFETLTSHLIGDYQEVNLYVVHEDYIVKSKVLFVLGMWENYLKDPNQIFVRRTISPICFNLASGENGRGLPLSSDLIEAAHSVLLAIFAFNKNTPRETLEYLDLLLRQFPNVLSANQLSIAIETLGKQTLSHPIQYHNLTEEEQLELLDLYTNSAQELLEFLYIRCSAIGTGIPINRTGNALGTAQPIAEYGANSTMSHIDEDGMGIDIIDANKRKKPKDYVPKVARLSKEPSEYEVQVRLVPETAREALIFSFINLVPYLPLLMFIPWLDRIMVVIDASNVSEREYLLRMLWRVLSENLDLNRCELGYKWWYETRGMAKL